ncbi:neurofilament heavy polypeptide-like [Osmerus eperlanus]|uniref:neurofilament heavy polypeptide-like n=1 Tax=Osmerus eperlanus TaxID=29151 RepID=UPI002E1666CD
MMDLCKGQKIIIRQFLILKNLGDVPDQVSLEHVKDMLLRVKGFEPAPQHVLSRPMLEEIEEKVFTELEKEQRLSKQFGRKVTLEGLEMFLCMIRPSAEAKVRNLLLPLFSNLACSAVHDTKGERESSPPAGDAGSPNKQVPTSTATLLQRAEKLVPELVTATLNYLLEDREEQLWGSLFSSDQPGLTSMEGPWAKAAIVDVVRLVEDAASSLLPPQDVSAMASITHTVVKNMVVAIFQRFEHALTSFQLIGHDSTEFDGLDVTRSVTSAIVDDMEMENMGTDVPEDFSNQMCEIATTAATPKVSMKDLLLEAATALKNNNISEGLIVEDGLPEAALEMSAEARGPEAALEMSAQARGPEAALEMSAQAKGPEAALEMSAQARGSEAAPKMSAQARGPEAALEMSAQARGHEAAPKMSAQARGPEAAPKMSAEAKGPEAAPEISAQARGHEAAPKMSAQARGHEAAPKMSAQAKGPEAALEMSAQARGHEAAPKMSAQARGHEAAPKMSAQARGHEAAPKMSAQARGHEAAPKMSAQARGPEAALEMPAQAKDPEAALEMSAQARGPEAAPKMSAQARGPEAALKISAEAKGPEAAPEISAQAKGPEAAPKMSAQARGPEAAPKMSAEAKGPEAAPEISAQAKGPEAALQMSAQARGPAVSMEDVLQELVMAHNDKLMKAVITEVTLDQVQPSPRSPKTTAASRFSKETLSILLEVEAPKVEPELSDEKPSVVIGCVLATTSDLQHPMNIQVLGDVCRDVAEVNRDVIQDLPKKRKKGGIRGFFRRVRKLFSCRCCGLPTEED